MIDLSDEDRRQVLGEILSDQLKAIFEYVKEIPAMKDRLDSIENRISSVENLLQMHEADIAYLRKKHA